MQVIIPSVRRKLLVLKLVEYTLVNRIFLVG